MQIVLFLTLVGTSVSTSSATCDALKSLYQASQSDGKSCCTGTVQLGDITCSEEVVSTIRADANPRNAVVRYVGNGVNLTEYTRLYATTFLRDDRPGRWFADAKLFSENWSKMLLVKLGNNFGQITTAMGGDLVDVLSHNDVQIDEAFKTTSISVTKTTLSDGTVKLTPNYVNAAVGFELNDPFMYANQEEHPTVSPSALKTVNITSEIFADIIYHPGSDTISYNATKNTFVLEDGTPVVINSIQNRTNDYPSGMASKLYTRAAISLFH